MRVWIGVAASTVACMLAAAAAQAAFPGENGRIAFTRVEQNGASDLYSVEPSGVAEIRITEDGQSANPAYSPDGSRLAHSSGTGIYVADPYGNGAQLVLATGEGVGKIDWSPDGTRLVVALTNCAEFDCEYDIYTVGIDGTGLTNLTNTLYSENNPAWSPDGSHIAFDSAVAGDQDVYVMNDDGTGVTNLTADTTDPAQAPDWSPDGSLLAFDSLSRVMTMDPADGTGKTVVFGGTDPAWSPEGTRIAVSGASQSRVTPPQGPATGLGTGRQPDWQVRQPDPVPPSGGAGYPRPKGATPFYVPLVLTYLKCFPPGNRIHGPPLAYPSCLGPRRLTSRLVVGTPDSANGLPAEATGVVRLDAVLGNPATPDDDADLHVGVSQTDVRYNLPDSGYPDYPGELLMQAELRVTDTWNAGGGADGSATVTGYPLRVVVPCAVTADAIGGSCALDTTMDALVPGVVRERRRSLWEIGQVVLYWEGMDGNPDTVADNQPFVAQGIFVP